MLYQKVERVTTDLQLRLSGQRKRNAHVFELFAAHHYMEKPVMTQLKFLTTAAALLVSVAATPAFAQVASFYGPSGELGYGPGPYYGQTYDNSGYNNYYGQNWTYDNSGWNGYNNGGFNNTWFDGRRYRSDPRPAGEDLAADAASGAPFRGYANGFGGPYAFMDDSEIVGRSDLASCEQRYKSYDPASGTYRGRDGKRHICN
jgi:hypothetical protein